MISIDASSKSLPKHPAVFSLDEFRQKISPILHRLYHHEDGGWFHHPVTDEIARGYSDVIKNPMDFSTISKKLNENQYQTPFQFCEDIWLVFNNTWTYNKKSHRVYKAGVKVCRMIIFNVLT
jgi:E1A/CREB-binding protein